MKYGYEPITQVYTLPRALALWSLAALAARVLSAVARLVGLFAHAPAIFFAGAIAAVLWRMHCILGGAFEHAVTTGARAEGAVESASVFQRVGKALRGVFRAPENI